VGSHSNPWFICKGFLRGIVDNLHDTLDKQYYSQLKHQLTAYQNITPFQILEHLNDRWCPLDIKAKKALKDAYYTKWDGNKHLTAFGKRLDDEKRALIRSDVTITDKDKLQFYLKQMYDSNHFDKNNMLEWEKQPNATKTNCDSAKDYFEALVKATDTYKQNSRGGTARRNKYKSANQLADYGNKIHEYIAKIASASASAANANATTNQFEAMVAQIKALTNAVPQLAATKENANPNAGGGYRGSNRKSRHQQMKKVRNMGGYCHSHGFHPIGADHDSMMCRWKKREHKTKATWNNHLGGYMYWPTAKRVAIKQQDHPPTWNGKLAPTS
jgi:hypothetical protein